MPRVTVLLLAGFVVAVAAMYVYVIPVLNQPEPPGAVAEWRNEQIKERLRGKVHLFLLGSYASVAAIGVSLMRRREARRQR